MRGRGEENGEEGDEGEREGVKGAGEGGWVARLG